MKKLLLTDIAALFLATGTAHAQTEEERQRGLTAHNTCQDVIGAKIETGANARRSVTRCLMMISQPEKGN